MHAETFKEIQEDIRNQDSVGSIANEASCWSTKIARRRRREKGRGQWAFPFGVVDGYSGGSDRIDFYFDSDRPNLSRKVELSDASAERPEYHSYDINTNKELKAPSDCNSTPQLLAWINEQGRSHLYFDGDSLSLVTCRGAKMATLDVDNWIESDRISTDDLRDSIRTQALTHFCVSGYRNHGDDFRKDRSKPVVPVIAVETKGGAITVLRPTRLRHRRPDQLEIEIRRRPDNWRRQWYSTFITGDSNETIGQRHLERHRAISGPR